MNKSLCLVAALALLVGCSSDGGAGGAKGEAARGGADYANALGGEADRFLTGGFAGGPQIQSIDVYQLTVPFGSVSRSEEFWKRVDEQSVDVPTYDLLLKNGIRVGVGPAKEWSYFKAIIDQYPVITRRSTVSGAGTGSIELLLKKGVDYQNLFCLTDQNELQGRTYERCENLLGVSFQPAPRKPGRVRMSICPLVRSTRKRFEVSVLNEESEYKYVAPEHVYDLNLCADIPVEGFLVVAPSPQAKLATSLGNTFLVSDGVAEQFEQVLLIVPRVTQLEEVNANPAQPAR